MLKFSLSLCLAGLAVLPGTLAAQDSEITVDFGDDSGMYINDGECDDPRFEGRVMGAGLLTDNLGRDASDCRTLFKQGRITLSPLFAPVADGDPIPYGDDTGAFTNDGECDDIRFTRSDASEVLFLSDDIGHDATDCRAAVEAGTSVWQGGSIRPDQKYMFESQMNDSDINGGEMNE